MSPLSTLTAYTPILENSAATPGLFDARFATLQQNVDQLNAAAGSIGTSITTIATLSLSGIFDVTSATYGAIGDGVTDNSSAFTKAVSAASRGLVLIPPGTYKLSSSLTLSSDFWPLSGATVKVASGKTLYITGHCHAGLVPWIDWTGGAVYIQPSARINKIPMVWYGVGSHATDDHAALVSLVSWTPEDVTYLTHSGQSIKLASTWTITNRAGLTVDSERVIFPNGTSPSPNWWWRGTGSGGSGNRLINIDQCPNFHIKGQCFNTDNIDIVLDIDGNGGGAYGFGTENFIEWNQFVQNSGQNASLWCVSIANTAANNQEYHQINNNHFAGGYGGWSNAWQFSSGVSTSPSTTLVWIDPLRTPPNLNSNASGNRVRIAFAGSGGTMHDTIIASVLSANAFFIRDVSLSTVTNTRCIVGEGKGIAIRIGGSYNAKKIVTRNNNISQFGVAFQQQNGSSQHHSNSFTNNEINYYFVTGSEACGMEGDNTEASRQHLVSTMDQPITMYGASRFQPTWTKMGGQYFDMRPGLATVGLIGANFDDAVPSGTTLWKLSNTLLRAERNIYNVPMTISQLGYTDPVGFYGISSEFESGISGALAASGMRARQIGSLQTTGLSIRWEGSLGSSSAVHFYGYGSVAGQAGAVNQAEQGGTENVGTRSVVGQDTPSVSIGCPHIGHRSELPIWSANPSGPIIGYTVKAPVASGTASANSATAYHAPAMKVAGITDGIAFYNEGVSDINRFNAPSSLTDGKVLQPAYAFSSESSLGLYRSGVSTLALSFGTLNLATNSVRLSVRTLASGDSTNIAVNEALFIVGGASGASIGIRSGGTIYYFASSTSTKG